MGAWQAHECLTQARQGAQLAWPEQRRRLEARYATGAPPLDPATTHACPACTAHIPSHRTLQRWHAERRRLNRPPERPGSII
jgi:hypothetical protein